MGGMMSKPLHGKEELSSNVDTTVKRAYQCGECAQCSPDQNQPFHPSISTSCQESDVCKTPRQDGSHSQNDCQLPQITNINQLPSSILVKIFSYLNISERLLRTNLVCHYWEKLCQDPDLWREIDISGQKNLNDDILLKLVSYSNNVTYLDVSDCYNVHLTDSGLQTVLKRCPNLQHLLLMRCGNCRYTDKALKDLHMDCPLLKTLRMDCLEITDSTLMNFAHSRNLSYLGLSQILTISDKTVTEIVKSCPNLKRLRLAQNHQIRGGFLPEVPKGSKVLQEIDLMMTSVRPDLIPNLSCLRNLKNLNLSQCESLELHDIMPVFNQCINMEVLCLNLVKKLDDTWVQIFVKKLTKLEQLFLISTKITDESLKCISTHLKQIMNIDVGYTKVTHIGVKHIADSCKHIKVIGLIQCEGVDEDEIEKMVPCYPNIHISTFRQDTKRILLKARNHYLKKS